MFTRLGRGVTRHPAAVIVVWLALVVAAISISTALGTPPASSLEANDLSSHYESAQAQAVLDKAFPVRQPEGTATLVFTRDDGQPLTAADSARVNAELQRLQADVRAWQTKDDDGTRADVATTGELSPNRLVQIATIGFDKSSQDPATSTSVEHIRQAMKGQLAGTGLQARMTGDAAQVVDSSFLTMLTSIGMVVAIVVLLLLLFRSILIAVMTVVTITVVGTGVNALLNIGAHVFHFTPSDQVTRLMPVVLFGVGTDYVVFLLFRYRERLRSGDDHKAALAAGVGRVGEAVVASALAVAASFSVMLVSQMTSFRVLGPALALAVVVMLFTVLTLVPAVLTLFGRRLARRASWHREPRARFTGSVGALVARRPVAVATACIGVLVIGAIGVLGYQANYEQDGYRKGSESAAGNADLQRGFPAGVLNPTQVVVSAEDGRLAPDALDQLGSALLSVPGVGHVSPGQRTPSGSVAVLDVRLKDDPLSTDALDVVSRIERVAHAQAPAGTVVRVGGATAAYNDVRHALSRDVRLILPIAALAIALILLLMLRAVAAPVVLMASVGLGFLATTGASVVVFQHAMNKDGLVFSMPLVVYLFVASLGTDYNILMVSRLREELRSGATPRLAAHAAVRQAGPAIAAAGTVLAVSFGLLIIGGGSLSEIGFAVAIGALISTFVMAFLLTPALFTAVGPRIWWPSRPQPARRDRPTDADDAADAVLVGATEATWSR